MARPPYISEVHQAHGGAARWLAAKLGLGFRVLELSAECGTTVEEDPRTGRVCIPLLGGD